MSTRKIREMQEWVAAHAGDVGNEWLAALAEEALAEVGAIEKASVNRDADFFAALAEDVSNEENNE